jgi:hypothetical protein
LSSAKLRAGLVANSVYCRELSCYDTIRCCNLLAENTTALRTDQCSKVLCLDVSKHVVLDASLHGHWLPVFVLDTSIAAVSCQALQFQLQFLIEFGLSLLLFRLWLLLLCNFGRSFLARISLCINIRLASHDYQSLIFRNCRAVCIAVCSVCD